ncbi:MAG: hypothetical protein V4528_07205 [Pseudomonadota bacterium]
MQVADRYAVEYIDENCNARIDVDFGAIDVGVYLHSLVAKDRNGAEINLSSAERDKIFESIVSGLEAMGGQVERL